MRNKKAILPVALAIILALSLLPTVAYTSSGEPPISVYLDGTKIDFADQEPIITDGRTLVPVRAIFEAFGMEVEWRNDNGEQQIWAQRGDFGISMYIDSHFMSFGNFADDYVTFRGQTMRPFESTQIELDVPPMMLNNRTLVPLRAISEALNAQVNWDEETRTVTITSAILYDVGDIINFGGIKWRILDVQDDRKLLLSEYVLFERAYHETHEAVTWATSTIRRYLNNNFYNRFSQAERTRIVETRLENNNNPWFSAGVGGNDTNDKIFLLSVDEVVRYFGDSGGIQNWTREQRTFNNALTDQYNGLRIAYDQYGEAAMWWLRTPGFNRDVATGIRPNGDIYIDGAIVSVSVFGVRPAMWLRMSEEILSTSQPLPSVIGSVLHLDLSLSAEDTLPRGFQIIGGSIYDRYGNILIALDEFGFTAWGTRISADFAVSYGEPAQERVAPQHDPLAGTLFRANLGDTASRGFHIIGGNIHDRYGQLLIEVDEYGRTESGNQLSPHFQVIYGGFPINEVNRNPAFDVAYGHWRLDEVDTFSGRIGTTFTMTYQTPRLAVGFFEGDMERVDFIIINLVNGQEYARIVNVPLGHAQFLDLPHDDVARSTDLVGSVASFEVRVIPRGTTGSAGLLVQRMEKPN